MPYLDLLRFHGAVKAMPTPQADNCQSSCGHCRPTPLQMRHEIFEPIVVADAEDAVPRLGQSVDQILPDRNRTEIELRLVLDEIGTPKFSSHQIGCLCRPASAGTQDQIGLEVCLNQSAPHARGVRFPMRIQGAIKIRPMIVIPSRLGMPHQDQSLHR